MEELHSVNFTERLRSVQRRTKSLLCIGLDVDPRLIPSHLRGSVIEFNRRIIEATHDLVCSYKLNLAFYEALGSKGGDTLAKTLEFIPSSIITIGDGKRGDIGNTSEQYVKALFDDFGFDAVTVNPYMGHDSIEPFLRKPERGVFLLALTSNQGSKDFQRMKIANRPLYEHVALKAKRWNVKQNIGLVVGATHPRELKRVRALVPAMPILIPGIGKQGGDVWRSVQYGCTREGDLAVITASRSILYASRGKDFAQKARREGLKMKMEIQRARELPSK